MIFDISFSPLYNYLLKHESLKKRSGFFFTPDLLSSERLLLRHLSQTKRSFIIKSLAEIQSPVMLQNSSPHSLHFLIFNVLIGNVFSSLSEECSSESSQSRTNIACNFFTGFFHTVINFRGNCFCSLDCFFSSFVNSLPKFRTC